MPALALLSSSLRAQLRLHIAAPHIATSSIFSLWLQLDKAAMQRICLDCLTFVDMRSADVLFMSGEFASHTYVPIGGKLAYIRDPLSFSGSACHPPKPARQSDHGRSGTSVGRHSVCVFSVPQKHARQCLENSLCAIVVVPLEQGSTHKSRRGQAQGRNVFRASHSLGDHWQGGWHSLRPDPRRYLWLEFSWLRRKPRSGGGSLEPPPPDRLRPSRSALFPLLRFFFHPLFSQRVDWGRCSSVLRPFSSGRGTVAATGSKLSLVAALWSMAHGPVEKVEHSAQIISMSSRNGRIWPKTSHDLNIG